MSQAQVTAEITDMTPFSYWTTKDGNIIVQQRGETTDYSNRDALQKAVNMLVSEYGHKGNERGDFADYTDLDTDQLVKKLNAYQNIYTRSDVKTTGGGRRFVKGTTTKQLPYTPGTTDLIDKIEVEHKVSDK